jgi:predicted DNA-binding transcriptional regulator YafY
VSRPASRVLGMLELLQARHGVTGAELARRLGVNERTIRRYAVTLAELGVPVTGARGRYGGYRLEPGYKLPPLMLTDDEAVAVVLGLVAADRLGLATAAPATGPALAKIQRMLPVPLSTRLAAVLATLGFTLRPRAATAPPASATLLALGAAARDRRRVRLEYTSWRGTTAARAVDPYGLVFHAGRWYLTGFDHRAGDLRTFRLDRVGGVRVGEETFDVPAGFDPVGQVTRSLAAVPYAHEVEVLLETDLATASARVPPSVASLAEVDGGVLLRARAERLDGMAQMLAGLGWPFTVRRPAELRGAVADLAARLAGWAGRAAPTGRAAGDN